jgi:uncharacterized protein YfaT (DUF1175 family)
VAVAAVGTTLRVEQAEQAAAVMAVQMLVRLVVEQLTQALEAARLVWTAQEQQELLVLVDQEL